MDQLGAFCYNTFYVSIMFFINLIQKKSTPCVCAIVVCVGFTACQPSEPEASQSESRQSIEFSDIEAALEAGVALVDVEEAFNNYYRRGVAQAEVDTISAELNGRLQIARNALAELFQEAEAARVGLESAPEDERADREQAVIGQIQQAQELHRRIEETEREYQRAIAARSAAMSAEIYQEIDSHINRLAQRDGYRIVINKGAKDQNGLPIFPYVYDRRDLTSEIIEAMNSSRPPDVVVQTGEASAASTPEAVAAQPEVDQAADAAVTEVLDTVDDLGDLIPEGVEPSEIDAGPTDAESP